MKDAPSKQFMRELYVWLDGAKAEARENQRVASVKAYDVGDMHPKDVSYWKGQVKYWEGCRNACVAVEWKFKLGGIKNE